MSENGVNALDIDRDAVFGTTPLIEHKGQRMDLSTLLEIRRRAACTYHERPATHEKDDDCIFQPAPVAGSARQTRKVAPFRAPRYRDEEPHILSKMKISRRDPILSGGAQLPTTKK